LRLNQNTQRRIGKKVASFTFNTKRMSSKTRCDVLVKQMLCTWMKTRVARLLEFFHGHFVFQEIRSTIFMGVCRGGKMGFVSLQIGAEGGFTQNPVTAYDPAYGQRQSSHTLHWQYPGELSRFRPPSDSLKIVLSKPDCRGCQ